MAIETALARASLDVVSRRDPIKMYHMTTLGELNALAPSFDWAKFFSTAGSPAIASLNVDVPTLSRGSNPYSPATRSRI